MSTPMSRRSQGRPSVGMIVLALVVLVALVDWGCGDAQATEPAKKESAHKHVGAATATRVEVAVLEPSTASLHSVIPGEVEGSRDATLASAQGGPIERLLVREGQKVKRGQLLMLVDEAMYTIRLRQAETRLRSAQRDVERAQGLGTALATAERDRRQTLVDAAQQELDLAKLQLSRSRIEAPFSGVISKLYAELGEVAGPAAPLIDLVQLDPVHVVMSVPDRDLSAVQPGLDVEVRVAALPDAFHGKIARISPTGDQDTRAFEAEVSVDNPAGHLKPGMIASVQLDRTIAEGAFVVPQDWLVTRLNGVGVFLDDDGKARFVKVTPGQVVRDQVIVREGLSEGARLVIKGHRNLADGDPLSIAREGVCCTDGRVRFD